MADDGGELVVEPSPALVVGAPRSSWLTGARAILVHAVCDRSVLRFVLSDEEGPAIVANGAEAELIVAVDSKCGSRSQATDEKEEE